MQHRNRPQAVASPVQYPVRFVLLIIAIALAVIALTGVAISQTVAQAQEAPISAEGACIELALVVVTNNTSVDLAIHAQNVDTGDVIVSYDDNNIAPAGGQTAFAPPEGIYIVEGRTLDTLEVVGSVQVTLDCSPDPTTPPTDDPPSEVGPGKACKALRDIAHPKKGQVPALGNGRPFSEC